MSVMSVGWGRCNSVSLHCSPGVDCNTTALPRPLPREPEKYKIVLSLGRVNTFQFCRLFSVHFGLHIIIFPL